MANSANAILQTHKVPIFRCPSDILPDTFSVAVAPNVNPDLPKDFAVANYIGSFGSTDYHPCATNAVGVPCPGNGVFFLNSSIREADIRDGFSNTMLAGERRSNPSLPTPIYGTWLGAPPGGVESIGRVLGFGLCSQRPPKPLRVLLEFHPGGANVVLCSGEVQFISENVDIKLFMGLATINKKDAALVFVPQ